MIDVDYIMSLIDWNQSSEKQKTGIQMAKNIQSINVFLQPCNKNYNKNVWDNCAQILSERTDDELSFYFEELMCWLQDMNWPGAECIYRRLKRYHEDRLFRSMLNECIREAIALKKDIWLQVLREFE